MYLHIVTVTFFSEKQQHKKKKKKEKTRKITFTALEVVQIVGEVRRAGEKGNIVSGIANVLWTRTVAVGDQSHGAHKDIRPLPVAVLRRR